MNKILIKHTLLFLLFCFWGVIVQAQNVTEELKKIRNAYLSNLNFSFDVEVFSYATKNSKTPQLMGKGRASKHNDKYYSSYGGYEMIISNNKNLMIDNNKKEMAFYDINVPKNKPSPTNINIDSLFVNSDSIFMRESKNGEKHFTSYSKTGYIKRTDIYVDIKTYFIKHIMYYYIESNEDFEMDVNRVEIYYKNIQFNNVKEDLFLFNKFFKIEKSKIYPIGRYQSYKAKYYNSKL